MISFVIVFCFIIDVSSLRFCEWQGHHTGPSPHVQTRIQQDINKILMQKQKPKQKKKITQQFQQLLQKNQQFRSYHPHYLHSYSYPQPITPHIYFGQKNNQGSFVFLLKNNETLRDNQDTSQIFFVNGQQQYGARNLLQRNKLRTDSKILNFMMVIQIENMLQVPIQTKITVYNFGLFLGVICQLYQDYYKSFIVYLSQKGKKAISLTEMSSQYSIQIKNLQGFDNRNTWRNSEEQNRIRGLPNVVLQKSSSVPHNFSTFIMVINHNSEQSAKNYKVAVQQFPIRDPQQQQTRQLTSITEIISQMSNVKIDSLQYKFRIPTQMKQQSCQTKAINQLLQGLSYEYGTLRLKNGSKSLDNKPKQLYSFTPSRKRFPWGFLWDDGFHCEVAIRSQPQLTLKVLKSWLDTMFQFGWIPRQQNRGPQRQYLCSCPNFMTKDVRDGNPPTLLLSLGFLARQGVLSRENFEEKYWQKLNNWYKWFKDTQTAQPGSYIFRWYDSIAAEGSFNSGMDDFPRIPNSIGHVDCQAWMYFFSQTLSQMSQHLSYEDIYYNQSVKIRQKLIENFIQDQSKIPNDFTIENGRKRFNSHFGYPSILAIAFGMIDQTTVVFNATMTKIRNQLDIGHGLASMSTRDSYYLANNDAYWRGPVWININYLFVRGLNLFYPKQKQYYQKLRRDLIKTVCGQEQQRGYFFQNYINGRGSFSYPFTGWTSLISIIVRQNY